MHFINTGVFVYIKTVGEKEPNNRGRPSDDMSYTGRLSILPNISMFSVFV